MKPGGVAYLQGEGASVLGHGVGGAGVVEHQRTVERGDGLALLPGRRDILLLSWQTCIFLLSPRMPLDWTRESRNWMSCRDRDRRAHGLLQGAWAGLSSVPVRGWGQLLITFLTTFCC